MEFMHHQSWKDALFLHYEADPDVLQALLPPGLVVDTYKGKAYVGVVALSELGITPTFFLPKWLRKLLALSHDAVNVRTYVRPAEESSSPTISDDANEDKDNGAGTTTTSPAAGIYFFTLDCSHVLPGIGARLLFHLPYRLAAMMRRKLTTQKFIARAQEDSKEMLTYEYVFQSQRRWTTTTTKPAMLDVEWTVDECALSSACASDSSSLAFFFMERYCLYNGTGSFLRLLMRCWMSWVLNRRRHERLQQQQRSRICCSLWRGRITHAPWPVAIQPGVNVTRLKNTLFSSIPGLSQAIELGAAATTTTTTTTTASEPSTFPIVHFSPGVNNVRFYFETMDALK